MESRFCCDFWQNLQENCDSVLCTSKPNENNEITIFFANHNLEKKLPED